MPSWLHEGLTELFRNHPGLAADMLTEPLAIGLPEHSHTRLAPADLTTLEATEYRADAVVVLSDDSARDRLGIIVEVQLNKDEDKRTSWPCYVTNLRARLRCPIALLAVCPSEKVARWGRRPIPLGPPHSVITPVVLGPHEIPVITDPDEALANPELSVLSAVANGSRPGYRRSVYEALVHLLRHSEDEMATFYTGLVLSAGPDEARKDLENIMAETRDKYRDYGSDFVNRYVNQGRAEGEALGRAEGEALGRAEGEANALITVLTTRGVNIPEQARERITACTDLDELDGWLKKAAVVDDVDELFG